MQAGARLDGHMVQGHVDQTATVTKIESKTEAGISILNLIQNHIFH
jgi:riboflavin synthase alpha subunit